MHFAIRRALNLPDNMKLITAYDVDIPAGASRALDRWYAVLGLPDPRSFDIVITYDVVKRQHRKLCLLMHPDKNPTVATDGAFKHVQDAFDVLAARHPSSVSAPHR
jgi:hypothetical protein